MRRGSGVSTVVLAFLLAASVIAESGPGVFAASGPAASSWPMFHGVASHTGYVGALGPQTATLKWKVFTGKSPATSNPPPAGVAVGSNGIVYVGGPQSILAINSATGSVVWYYNASDPQGPAVDANGNIYASTFGILGCTSNCYIFFSLNSSGRLRWSYSVGNHSLFGSVMGSDGTIYQGTWDRYFYAFNPDGTLRWKYPSSGTPTAGTWSYSPSIGPDGTIYAPGGDAHAGNDPHLYAFDHATGALKWETDTSYKSPGGTTIVPPRVSTPAVAGDGTIYAPASGVLEALNSAGTVLWTYGASASLQPAGVPSSLIGPDGTLFMVGDDGVVTALNTTTHQPTWTYHMGCASSTNCGAPMFPVVDGKGDTFWGSLDDNVYALNSQGQLLWKYATGAGIAEAAAAMDSSGNLYVSSEDGYTYAFAGPSQSATSTSSSTSSTSSTTSAQTFATSTVTSTFTTTSLITSTTTATSTLTRTTTTTATALVSSTSTATSTFTTTSTATSTEVVTATTTTTTATGAVPEFSPQLATVGLLTFLLVASYILARRMVWDSKPIARIR